MRIRAGCRSERGDVLIDGLVQALAIVAAVALLCFELVAVGVNVVGLDDLAGDVARGAAATLPAHRNAETRRLLAEQEVRRALAEHPSVVVQQVMLEPGGAVSVTLARPPRTALLHRFAPLARLLPQAATAIGRPPVR